MGKPGPQPAPQKDLRRFTNAVYSCFLELAKTRRRFDRNRYEDMKERARKSYPPLTEEEQSDLEQGIADIKDSRWTEAEKDRRIRNRVDGAQADALIREFERAQEFSMRRVDEQKRWFVEGLLVTQTPDRVRETCKNAFPPTMTLPVNLKEEVEVAGYLGGDDLARILETYAEQFIAAKHEKKYPRSATRASSRRKQLWFLSCALAGAVYGIKTRTAFDRLQSRRRPGAQGAPTVRAK